jgi:hypothetical protein
MIRILTAILIAGSVTASAFAQSKTPPPQYTAASGRCGISYILENTPPFFSRPKTKKEISYVIRILRSAPPAADVKCSDLTDAWSPYLYGDRKVRIAVLLIRLKRYREAREELWSLFLDRPVLYGKRKLYYNFGTNDAAALIVSPELWNAADIPARLNSSKYRNTGEIKKAYQKRLSLVSPK